MNVLLVGKNFLCREGIKQVLHEIQYNLVYETNDFTQLKKLSDEYTPDIILVEISEKEFETINSIVAIKTTHPKIKLMLLCEDEIAAPLLTKVQSKIDSIVNTSVSKEEIILAIHSVLSGHTYFTPSVVKILLHGETEKEPEQQSNLFTEREIQILNFILKGRSNEQIADILFLSEKTVATHKRNIMKKAQVKKTSDLILFALDNGFCKGKYA